jgi:hypothetical protein
MMALRRSQPLAPGRPGDTGNTISQGLLADLTIENRNPGLSNHCSAKPKEDQHALAILDL